MTRFPRIVHTVLDTTDARGLAEFYRELLGLDYAPGHEPPDAKAGGPDNPHWLVLVNGGGANVLAFQQVERLEPTTWPAHDVPMQMHLDFTVSSIEELIQFRDLAESLGARLLLDRTGADTSFCVYADPAGHPFCTVVGW